jgi:hypothetical protein
MVVLRPANPIKVVSQYYLHMFSKPCMVTRKLSSHGTLEEKNHFRLGFERTLKLLSSIATGHTMIDLFKLFMGPMLRQKSSQQMPY